MIQAAKQFWKVQAVSLNPLENWLSNHLTLVASVGLPLLTVSLTGWVSYLTTKANTKAQGRQRDLDYQLKLAEFRRSWINDVRDDFAIYTARTWDKDLNEGKEPRKEQVMAQARILMRMSPSDPEYETLLHSLRNPVAKSDDGRNALFELGSASLNENGNE